MVNTAVCMFGGVISTDCLVLFTVTPKAPADKSVAHSLEAVPVEGGSKFLRCVLHRATNDFTHETENDLKCQQLSVAIQ
jgi:hypothetical protein